MLSALERKGVRARSFGLDSMEFQNFVVDVGLVDLPLCGRRFTWYRSDGSAMSRLDCFLISDGWLESNPNVAQWALERGLSDHCPIVLKEHD